MYAETIETVETITTEQKMAKAIELQKLQLQDMRRALARRQNAVKRIASAKERLARSEQAFNDAQERYNRDARYVASLERALDEFERYEASL
jgi:DNA repair exonuclease SbcCD ATPase subunit